MPAIYVDADACPVKEEVYRVAQRFVLKVFVVANARMRVPDDPSIELCIVGGEIDAADDWIADRVAAWDVVIATDILLAARCLAKDAIVLSPTGKELTSDTIGDAVATRELLAHLREYGSSTGGPAPFEKRDRSRFLQRLDLVIQRAMRKELRVTNES